MDKTHQQLLANLQRAADKEQHPNLPDYARTTKKLNDTTANQLQTSILTYCNLQQHTFSMRINTTGIFDVNTGKYRKSGATKGVSDVIICYKGRFIGVEVKVGKDKQRDTQKKFEENIKKSGGVYIIVRTFDEFLTKYTEIIKTIA